MEQLQKQLDEIKELLSRPTLTPINCYEKIKCVLRAYSNNPQVIKKYIEEQFNRILTCMDHRCASGDEYTAIRIIQKKFLEYDDVKYCGVEAKYADQMYNDVIVLMAYCKDHQDESKYLDEIFST